MHPIDPAAALKSLETFHPLIQRWFQGRFAAPTEPQARGWPRIAGGEHTLIAAPTGSGKTLTAFLAAIDRLLKESVAGKLPQEMRVIYVSPLRALSNDMHRNLEVPLAEITELAQVEFPDCLPIRAGLRTGDTPASQRAALIKKPPHILVTTPESLYLLLTSPKGRERLRSIETIIVDEIHALVRDKRGSHLALSLERLAELTERPLQRIGLSATQRPIEEMAAFLVGVDVDPAELQAASEPSLVPSPCLQESLADDACCEEPEEEVAPVPRVVATPPCAIVDVGHQRDLDLAIEVPQSDLGAVCMHEQWAEVNARLCELIQSHRSTLIFVNTRRMAERVTHQLTQLLGEDAVSSHHGSLAANLRHDTEQRLKSGQLKAVVATASLELGLDIGFIDLVIQLGSPRAIATFLQRVGRSGHALGLVPKGRLFALTRDELMESMALVRAIRAGRLDAIVIPKAPLDILAQQIVAEVSSGEWGTDDLFAMVRRAWPYRDLPRREFDRVIEFLAEGISSSAGRGRVYLHHDQVGRRVRARPGARIVAASNGGAIPEIASYRVVAEPEQTVVGTLDEDFASESQAGEIFLLGNTSWRIIHVRGNDVTVADAQGAPPSIPFWRGEAPGRTIELSEEVSELRRELEQRLEDPPAAEAWLVAECAVAASPAHQAVEYVRAQQAALGLVPNQQRIVFERFFDESGGMQMVIHAPFGARICKAWGLAMRKRFCRSFDFELQATADDDGFVLSLGPQHSFPLESMFPMLTSRNAPQLLQQALLYVPTFQTRWRWNVTRALLVQRFRNGKKVPPALQRFRADDLLTAVFPKLTGCQENVTGDLELPDHPLAWQSMHDALQEAHDLDGLVAVLRRIEQGQIELIARDTREPSPFCYELLNADPYAFLDGGEVAERRTRAVATRRSLTVESVSDLGRLDPEAMARVREEAQPLVRSADELHDVLLSRIVIPACADSAPAIEPGAQAKNGAAVVREALPRPSVLPTPVEWGPLFAALVAARRGTWIRRPGCAPQWAAAERLPAVMAAFPEAIADPPLTVPDGVRRDWTAEDARVVMVRGLVEVSGPVTASEVSQCLGIEYSQADASLEALEGEGVVLRGRFTNSSRAAQDEAEAAVRAAKGQGATTPDAEGEASAATPAPPPEIEWCHRRLLARIHRLTMEGLRREIEPVTVDVFLRFLARHHGLLKGWKRAGASGLYEVVSMLQGIDLPAVVWERDVLASRVEKYRPELLDELCLTGEIGWGRLYPVKRVPDRSRPLASLTRVAPMSLFLRTDLGWLDSAEGDVSLETLSSPAQQVYALLTQYGAMFAADLIVATRMLPSQLGDVLGELVTQGLVTADGFAGLRALLTTKATDETSSPARITRRRVPMAGAGRWSLWRRGGGLEAGHGAVSALPAVGPSPSNAAEGGELPVALSTAERTTAWAWQLLRRWGVIFRDLLEREPGAPRWFDLLQVLRRLEARGEIRGGRFITGVAGEQFALGDTVRLLRQLRDEGPKQELVVIPAADPLNLVGILTKHDRVTSNASNRVAYLDGVPVAALVAGELRYLLEPTDQVRKLLHDGRALRGSGALDEDVEPVVADQAETEAKPAGTATDVREKPKGKPRTQKSLFPRTIPRPFIR
ncbi:MAG: DEAD/DEAH box helicase [Planctomycetes bacterium]|nr:DEAD/DEAH box helicase [Planctomycetota bacterium]